MSKAPFQGYIQIDTREFIQALKEVARESSRTAPEIVNGQALALSYRAINHTKIADKSRIGWRLGQVGTKIRVDRKTGKLKKGAAIYTESEDSLAARIVNKRRRDSGQSGLHGKELLKEAAKFTALMVRSAGYIRSGWIPAILTLKAAGAKIRGALGGGGGTGGAKVFGAGKGGAVPALLNSGRNAVAEIYNRAGTIGPDHQSPEPIAIAGLQAAMAESVDDMRRHIIERYQKLADKHAGR